MELRINRVWIKHLPTCSGNFCIFCSWFYMYVHVVFKSVWTFKKCIICVLNLHGIILPKYWSKILKLTMAILRSVNIWNFDNESKLDKLNKTTWTTSLFISINSITVSTSLMFYFVQLYLACLCIINKSDHGTYVSPWNNKTNYYPSCR